MKYTFAVFIFFSTSIFAQCFINADISMGAKLNTTGSQKLDQILVTESNRLKTVFGVEVELYAYDDKNIPNAYASQICSILNCDGSVKIGKTLLLDEIVNANGYVSVVGIMAHEYAHIFQFQQKTLLKGKYTELQADYLAGWYLAQTKDLSFEDLEPFAISLYNKGDYAFWSKDHHGTPKERSEILIMGFMDNSTTINEAFKKSLTVLQGNSNINKPNNNSQQTTKTEIKPKPSSNQTPKNINDDKLVLFNGGGGITIEDFKKYSKRSKFKLSKSNLEIIINFKAIVKEAEAMNIQETESFKTELNGYKRNFVDKKLFDQLVNEAIERKKIEIRASHVLVKCAENDLSKDTMIAYNKIKEYRKRALNGEDFDKLAIESAKLGDPSAEENKGDLGCFSVFDMVYPFENAAYKTKVNEISEIVRTRFGYHIMKVVDKRPNQGEILVSHIMVRLKKEMNKVDSAIAKKKIEEIFKKVKAGEKFDDLARQYSEDKQSAEKGGELSWFSAGKMPVVEFETKAFSLKNNGDFSEPFMTKYGWHILRKLESRSGGVITDLDKQKLIEKIWSDSRVSPAMIIGYQDSLYEYYEGILSYEIMDLKVWKPAREGAKKYYEENSSHYNYVPFENISEKVISDYQKKLHEELILSSRKKHIKQVNYEKLDLLKE